MKKSMMIMIALLYIFIGSAMLFAAGTWTPKADAGGIGKEALFGVSNGNKGYTGTGVDDPHVYNNQGKVNPGATPASILYAYFTGYGLYSHNGSTWTWLHPTEPTSMVASGANLYAYFSGYGLYKYNGAAWTYLHPTEPTSISRFCGIFFTGENSIPFAPSHSLIVRKARSESTRLNSSH